MEWAAGRDRFGGYGAGRRRFGHRSRAELAGWGRG